MALSSRLLGGFAPRPLGGFGGEIPRPLKLKCSHDSLFAGFEQGRDGTCLFQRFRRLNLVGSSSGGGFHRHWLRPLDRQI